MSNVITFWNFYSYKETQADYIPKDIKDPSKLGNPETNIAQKAILWLLSKAPHTVDEIADHFEISPELVKYLIKDLTAAKLVVSGPEHLPRHQLKQKRQKDNNLMRSANL